MKNLLPCLSRFLGSLFFLATLLPPVRAGVPMNTFNIENSTLVDNPWAAVSSSSGNITMPEGLQFQVNDSGAIVKTAFSPSIAVGDLNGDGKPDLVVADPRGYIWFFPNLGTPQKAAFGHGEVIPIWFGADSMLENNEGYPTSVVPRIQLLDLNGDGKLDLVVGTFDGRLYTLANQGSTTMPVFKQQPLESIEIPTHTQGLLWCTYLAPCLYDWSGRGIFDLIMGEGTYSANSIYLLKNQSGASQKPAFDEKHTLRMLPGNGREQLTPRVIDWNGDGKPDVICGERSGYIDLYLNTSTDPNNPTFSDPPQHLRLGSQDQFGQLTTVEIADLNGNKLPNILFSNSSGELFYAVNTGTPGHPVFATNPVPLKGTNPYPKVYLPLEWTYDVPFGNAYEMLVATSADVEPGFTLPDGHKGKFALRAYLFPPTTTTFTGRYVFPPEQEINHNQHYITYGSRFLLQDGKRYSISFAVKTGTDGDASDFQVQFRGGQHRATGGSIDNIILQDFGASSSWNTVTQSIEPQTKNGKKGDLISMELSLRWKGTGSVYFDDIVVSHED
jgi:VCBS repeat protein/FG-GAP repeat protein